jgi:predicted transcriptional regulator
MSPPVEGPAPASRDITLGTLETRVMECLWKNGGLMSVRDVSAALNGPWAYTTLMTTLDRLFKKGLAAREPRGRAFVYRGHVSKTDLGVRAVTSAVSNLEAGSKASDLAIAALVDAIEARNPDWLDSLDRLVREKRKALRQGK